MSLADVFRYYPGHTSDELPPTAPWRSDYWLWATQGHLLVAVADEASPADPVPEKFQKGTHYIVAALDHPVRVPLSALRNFVGPVEPPNRPCDTCEGTGRSAVYDTVKCQHCGQYTAQECDDCGGDGIGGLPVRYGRICGVPLNLSLLAFGLAQVPPCEIVALGTVRPIKETDKEHHPLAVQGDGWRVVLMGMKNVAEDVPTFAVEPAGAAAREGGTK